MEDQLNEVLETVRFLKENMLTKEEGVTKTHLAQALQATEERLEKKIIFGVAEFMEQSVLPQLDAMNQEMGNMRTDMNVMGMDIKLIKIALSGNTVRL